MTSRANVEAEVQQFFIDITGDFTKTRTSNRPSRREQRVSLPAVGVPEICDHALALVDNEGLQALTMRRLADDLKISSRTLYKRIHSRDNVIRVVAAAFVERLDTTVTARGSWGSTALAWCVQLRESLTAHPHLTNLLDARMLSCRSSDVEDLVDLAVEEGLSKTRAATYSKALLHVTINDALAQVRDVSSIRSAKMMKSNDSRKLDFIVVASLLIDGARQ